jgi:hypothetical protein
MCSPASPVRLANKSLGSLSSTEAVLRTVVKKRRSRYASRAAELEAFYRG